MICSMWYKESTYAGRYTARFSVARKKHCKSLTLLNCLWSYIYEDYKSKYFMLDCLVLQFFHKHYISKMSSLFFPALLFTPSFSFPFHYQRGFRINPIHVMETFISWDKGLHSLANGWFIQTFYRNRKLKRKSGNREEQGRKKTVFKDLFFY